MQTPPTQLVASRRPLPGLLLLLAMACLPALPQTAPSASTHTSEPATGSYRIAGTVVNAVSGEPVRRATVAVLAEEDSHTVASVESDSEGRFSLERLPAAKYQLTASKRGFRSAFYDEHDEFSTAIVTGPGQETGSLTFRLVPGAVLHGVVAADGGDPVEGATVMLFLKPSGRRQAKRITQVDSVTTDDTGAYEFSNLAAGEYLVAVTAEPWYALHRSASRPRQNPGDSGAALDLAFPVTFFDSTTEDSSATRIVLAGGSREEANINLHAVPALHLVVETPRKPDGSIVRPELRQTVFGTVVSTESAGFLDSIQSGTTEFTGVAPGRYELAQGDPPRIVDLDATTSQQVDPSLGTPTVTVTGTLRNPSGSALPYEATVTLNWLDGPHRQEPVRTVSRNGWFSFGSAASSEWGLSAEAGVNGKPLVIVSTTVGSRTRLGNLVTVRDRPLSVVVTVSEVATRIEGFARRDGEGVAGVMVVLAPKDLTTIQGLVRRDQSDSDGSFALRDVVPGQYTVVAIEDGWNLDWEQPGVIGRYLPRGIAVTVTDRSGKLVPLSEPVPVQTR